jgi:hypothetical protein
MTQTTATAIRQKNFWWGLGVNVESQDVLIGVNAMVTRMFAFADWSTSCVIRVSSAQFGPGLGGGADSVLVIATGIASPTSFPMAKVDGGWNVSLRDVVSASSTPKSCIELAHLIRTVPTSEIVDFAVKNPSYFLKLKDVVGAFYDTMVVGADAVMDSPRLWIFPVAGIGFELGLTYRCGNRTELLAI